MQASHLSLQFMGKSKVGIWLKQGHWGLFTEMGREAERDALSFGDCELQGPMSLVRLMPIFPFTWRKFVRAQNQHRWKQRGERERGRRDDVCSVDTGTINTEGQPIVFFRLWS